MPSAPLVKVISELVVDSDYTFSKPYSLQDGSRFSTCRGPYLQTCELPVTLSETGNATVICTDAYADVIAQIEEHAIDTLANNAQKWFGRELSHEDVEQLMKASIKGHRVPKHVLCAKSVKCYDHNVNLLENDTTGAANGTCIIRVDGIKLEEKRAEVCFTLQQLKFAEDASDCADTTPELDGPAFV